MTKVSVFLITAALIAGMVGCGPGDDNLPPSQNLEIRTWYDLDAVRDNMDGNHTLMNDLNSTTPGYEELASPTANGGKGWQPITTYQPGYGSRGFSGTFDGRGHTIRDLFINRPGEDGVGLFTANEQVGVIKDVGVVNATVTGHAYVGGLVGTNPGTVINSYSSGDVTSEDKVGGLAGSSGGVVLNSSSSGNVTENSSAGGLVGRNLGTVDNSYATSNVTGLNNVGGLVGWKQNGTVSNSYSTGNVIGLNNVGGLVGLNEGADLSNSYSTGSVAGSSSVGGLVGLNGQSILEKSRVTNSYCTGSVTGNDFTGGLVGRDEGTVSNSFWDTEATGQATSDGGMGKNTTEMQDVMTFSWATWNITAVANPSLRDLSYIWNIVDNVTYPFLSWQS